MKSVSNELFWLTYKNRVPLYSIIELTYSCNLNCIHCYIPEEYRRRNELPTEEFKKVILDIAELGGLYLVFSGGEPLLRKDIFELIKFSKKLNFVVVVFSNGSLITKNIAKKLKDSGVDKVEVSIYGQELIHDKFVKKRVFKKVEEALALLKEYKINFALKTVLTKYNYDEYEKIVDLAKRFDVVLKTDLFISPKINGKKDNLKLLLEDSKILRFLRENKFYVRKTTAVDIKSLSCSAGFNVVNVSAEGNVYPCVEFPYLLGNIKEKSFKDIWVYTKYPSLVNKIYRYKECINCDLVSFCNRCPGMCYIESKSLFGCSYVTKKMAEIISLV